MEDFIRTFKLALIEQFDPEEVNAIINSFYLASKDYEIKKISHELIVYEDENKAILKQYAGCMIIQGKAKGTVKQYVNALNKLIEFTGKRLLEITTNDIRCYIANLIVNDVKKVTANNTRNYISSFFKWAKAEKLIEDNPCECIQQIKYEQEFFDPFTEVEIDKIRNATASKRDRAIVELLYSSGIRINELCTMKRSDIDINTMTVHVRQGKGGKDRITYVNNIAVYHLKKYFETRTDDDDALFLSFENRCEEERGKLSTNGVRGILIKIGEKAGVEKIHPHRFRHTFATTMYNRGMDIHEIQKLLGHGDVSVTMRYIHTNDANLKSSYSKFAN